jgi:ribosomal protein S12 methylthiotransferase
LKETPVYLLSLGCPKNLVDAEVMSASLFEGGFRITPREKDAEVVIVNTCAFIRPAREESVYEVLRLAGLKRRGKCRYLIVTGCLPQRYGRSLFQQLPEVDLFLGPDEVPRITGHLNALLSQPSLKRKVYTPRPLFLMTAEHPRHLSTPPHTAYLKIADGCSNRCAYCVIPAIRGRFRSRPMEDVLREAGTLAGRGVKEVVLVAQDTTAYGRDLKGKPTLAELLTRLAGIEEFRWIRVLYTYPANLTTDLLETIAREDRICKYLDVPVQHIDDEILAAMNRRGNSKLLRGKIQLARAIVPGIALRTSLIVGFPGETRGKFEKLLRFVEEIRFEHLGVFIYSREEGTRAFGYPSQISEKLKKARRDTLMKTQAFISAEINRSRTGTFCDVLIEGRSENKSFPFIGRTMGQTADIDGVTFVRARAARVGDMLSCRIVSTDVYDLFAKRISKKP